MELAELMNKQYQFDARHAGRFEWSAEVSESNLEVLQFLIVALAAEVGEAASVVKSIVRGDAQYEDAKEALASEIADVFAYTMKCANQIGFDLEERYLAKLSENEGRFADFTKSAE